MEDFYLVSHVLAGSARIPRPHCVITVTFKCLEVGIEHTSIYYSLELAPPNHYTSCEIGGSLLKVYKTLLFF